VYRISSNKRPGAYLKFQLKRGALIGRRALNRGGRLLSFPFNKLQLYFGKINPDIAIGTYKVKHVHGTESLKLHWSCAD